jgi:hypothetical protein
MPVVLTLALTVVLVVACDQRPGPTTPGPSPTVAVSRQSQGPVSASPHTSTDQSPPPEPGGELDLAAAVAALGSVASYDFTMSAREGRTEDRYAATVVRGPPSATSGRLETTTGAVRVIVIGARAWIARSSGPFTPVTLAEAQAIHEPFAIATVVAPYTDPAILATLRFAGPEPRNGTVAGRYVADAAGLGRVRNVTAGASLEVWVDADGRLIALEAVGVERADGSVQVDVAGIDDPSNEVEPPG